MIETVKFFSRKFKDLGTIMDSKLKFSLYIDGIVVRACKVLSFIIRQSVDLWVYILLYSAFVRTVHINASFIS